LLYLLSEPSTGDPDAGLQARSPEQLQQFLTIPHSFLALRAGMIDGDGYIPIIKTTKGYIEISLVIGLDVRDSELLKTLQATLGLGKVSDPVKNKDGFALEEVNLLAKTLTDNFNLNCSIIKSRNNHIIRISSKSIPHLQTLLTPIMPPMMRHKILGKS
jgi:hypothetical protein